MKITITKTIQLKPNQIKRLKKITIYQLQNFLVKHDQECTIYDDDFYLNWNQELIVFLLCVSKNNAFNSFSGSKIITAINQMIKELENC